MRWRLAVVAAFAALIGIGALVAGRRAPEAAASAPPEPPRGLAAAALTFRPAVTATPQLPPGALAAGETTFAPGGEIAVPLAMRWSVEGASPTAPEPADPLPGVEHFFLGNDPARWRTDVPRHESALYRQLRPGLDVKATPRRRGLTLTVTASPEALRDTWFRWDGPARAKVEEGGRLALATPEGTLTQTLEGPVRLAETRALPGGGLAYRLEAEIQPTGATLGSGTFQAGVTWANLLPTGFGGTQNSVNDVHASPDGTIVVVGETQSNFFGGALDGGMAQGQDAYVAKFDVDAGLIWGAYLGGASSEFGEDVAFDSTGNLYVVGKTLSLNYPVFPSTVYQNALRGGTDVFVTSLVPSGNAIRWSTYLGGTNASTVSEDALAVGIDRVGNVWLGGYTGSANFPTVNAFDPVCDNTGAWPSADGFIAALNDAGTNLLFSSFLGGAGGLTQVYDLAFDPVSGDVFAVGDTISPSISAGTGPFTPPLQGAYTGTQDGFMLRLPTSGTYRPSYFSYLGGSVGTSIETVAFDSAGAIYLGGVTSSPNFPVDGGLGYPLGGGREAFVTKLVPSAAFLEWSTLFGGTGDDDVRNLALDPNGAIWLAGHTASSSIFGFDGGNHGSTKPYDAFAARLSVSGDSLDWAAFLGGNGNDDGRGIALDGRANAYVAGDTDSPTFPTAHSNNEGFLLKIDTTPPGGGAVRDGLNLGMDDTYQTVSTGFAANWNGFSDPDSPVIRYEFGLGTAPGLVDVTGGYRDAGSMPNGAAGGLSLAQGQTYYATVRAITSAGLVSAPISSNGITVDTDRPPDGGVRDGPGADRQFQRLTDPIEANWDPMVDPTSGTVFYKWAIGTDAADNDVQDYTDVGLALSARNTAVTTVGGKRYHVTVKAVNGAGLFTLSGSNGVVVDGTPPAVGAVSDGPISSVDVDEQPRTAPVEATWSGFLDPESGIARYEYAVGTSAGGTELQGFTSVGTATSASAGVLSVPAGTRYFVSVRAYNNAGDFSTASSDGVLALGVDGDQCTSPDQCASKLCRNTCLPAGTAVLLAFSRDGGAKAHFGERVEISAEVTSVATDLPEMKLLMTADGLALAAADAGTATCDQGETLPVGPVAADETVVVPVYAYVCRAPGGDPPSLTGHLEALDGGRLTTDVTFEVSVEPGSVPVGCTCTSAPGALAVAALLWAIGRRRKR